MTYILWSSNFASYLEDYLMEKRSTWDNGSLWLKDRPCKIYVGQWPIFHGPLILPYIIVRLKLFLYIKKWHRPGVFVPFRALALVLKKTRSAAISFYSRKSVGSKNHKNLLNDKTLRIYTNAMKNKDFKRLFPIPLFDWLSKNRFQDSSRQNQPRQFAHLYVSVISYHSSGHSVSSFINGI